MLFADIALRKGLYYNNDSKTYLIESDDVVVAFVVGVARRLRDVHTSVISIVLVWDTDSDTTGNAFANSSKVLLRCLAAAAAAAVVVAVIFVDALTKAAKS